MRGSRGKGNVVNVAQGGQVALHTFTSIYIDKIWIGISIAG